MGGGLRKLRFARQGAREKAAGSGRSYFYRPAIGPVVLLALFAKNEKANLTASELATLLKLGDILAAHYGKRA